MKYKIIKDDYNFQDFELRFIKSVTLMSSVVAVIASLINLFIDAGITLTMVTLSVSVIFFLLYLWAKSDKKVQIMKITLTVIIYTLINLVWRYNNGSRGPGIHIFILAFSLFVFIWSGYKLIIIAVLLYINTSILFYIDFNNPTFTDYYQNEYLRIIDTYSCLFIYSFVIVALVNRAKKSLQQELVNARLSDKLKSAFLANMNHEIRTPLNAITGFSQLLKDPNFTDEEKQYYADLIVNQGQYLASLINELIEISKIESDNITINNSEVNLDEIIENVHNAVSILIKEGVELRINPDPKLRDKLIITDAVKIRQIITNLMHNAAKFTFKGYIEIGYRLLKNKQIQIYVKDSGIGIPESEIDKVFERFYQVEQKNKTILNEGTGLGLAITKALINMMGGEIRVESIENSGSVFRATLPFIAGGQKKVN